MFWRLRRSLQAAIGPAIIASHRRLSRGKPAIYEIPAGYRHRSEPFYFDDTGNEDEWQREVYAFAAALMKRLDLRTVYDVGCGGAYKLIHYLGAYETVGFDVEQTVGVLRSQHPGRRWEGSNFDRRDMVPPDLVVCSDVIEHVPDPDALLIFIREMRPKHIVLSTPDRDLIYPRGSLYNLGPPENRSHMREWNFAEFGRYIGSHFDVVERLVTNREQGTQMIYCRPRPVRVAPEMRR